MIDEYKLIKELNNKTFEVKISDTETLVNLLNTNDVLTTILSLPKLHISKILNRCFQQIEDIEYVDKWNIITKVEDILKREFLEVNNNEKM